MCYEEECLCFMIHEKETDQEYSHRTGYESPRLILAKTWMDIKYHEFLVSNRLYLCYNVYRCKECTYPNCFAHHNPPNPIDYNSYFGGKLVCKYGKRCDKLYSQTDTCFLDHYENIDEYQLRTNRSHPCLVLLEFKAEGFSKIFREGEYSSTEETEQQKNLRESIQYHAEMICAQ